MYMHAEESWTAVELPHNMREDKEKSRPFGNDNGAC